MHLISIIYFYIQLFCLTDILFAFSSRILYCLFTRGHTDGTTDTSMASTQCAHLIVAVVRVLEVCRHLVLVGLLHNPGHWGSLFGLKTRQYNKCQVMHETYLRKQLADNAMHTFVCETSLLLYMDNRKFDFLLHFSDSIAVITNLYCTIHVI